MDISLRSCLTTGVATITAAAVAFAPSIEPAPPLRPAPPQTVHVASPAITLTAGVQPLAAASVTDILGFVEHYVVPPSAGQPFPTPQFPPLVAPTSIGSSIIWVYNAVEPWARYAADLAAYAVGWVPYVGWLAPQITIFYNFGERIARSITYNIAYWLDGNISFGQGLVNVGVDTVNAFIQLGIDQWNFWLWPLPPLPPIFPGTAATQTAELTATAAVSEDPLADTPKLKKKDLKAVDEAVDSEAPTIAAVETTEAEQEAAVEKPKEPKSTTAVAVSGEIRGVSAADATGSTKVSKDDRKADMGPTAKGASESNTSTSHGTKSDDNGKKKADKE